MSEVRALLESGASLEGVIGHMRAARLNQIESIEVLEELYGIPRREADEAVRFSETWADALEATLQLEDMLWTFGTEWADEVESFPDGRVLLTFHLDRSDDELFPPDDLLPPSKP